MIPGRKAPDPSVGEGAEGVSTVRVPAVAIGASTGGPKALLEILGGLPADFPAYLFIVQHIHRRFTGLLARRLAEVAPFPVSVARDGERAARGRAYVAPAGAHLVVEGRAGLLWLRLLDAPPCHGVRPAADYLFRSLAEAWGPRTVAVVLTGMGRDGLQGARVVRDRGGLVLAEAPESCVVYGMPRALAEAALADRLVPLAGMAGALWEAVQQAARAPSRWAARGAVGRR